MNSSHARAHPDGSSSPGGLALVPEDSSGSKHGRGSQQDSARAVLRSRGCNTINDNNFFEGLPQLLTEVTDKLEELLSAGQGLDLSAIAAAAAQAGLGSTQCSSAASTARRRSGGGSTEPTPRSTAIRSMQAGLLPAAAEYLRASNDAAKAAAGADATRASNASSGGDVASSRASADPSVAPEASTAGSVAGAAAEPTAGNSEAGASAEDAAAAADSTTAAAEGEQGVKPADGAAEDASPPAAAEGSARVSQEVEGAGAADAGSTQEPLADAAPAQAQAPPAAADAADAAPGATSSTDAALAPAAPAAAATVPADATEAAAAGSAPGSVAATPGSFLATQSPMGTVMRSSAASSILMNEKALLKGLHRWGTHIVWHRQRSHMGMGRHMGLSSAYLGLCVQCTLCSLLHHGDDAPP